MYIMKTIYGYFGGFEGYKDIWDYFSNAPYFPYGKIEFVKQEEAYIFDLNRDRTGLSNVVNELLSHRKWEDYKLFTFIDIETEEELDRNEYLSF